MRQKRLKLLGTLLVLLLSLSCQEPETEEEVSPEELVEQADSLVSSIESTRTELERLRTEIASAQGDSLEALEFQYSNREQRLFRDLFKLAEDVASSEELGQDTSAQKSIVESALNPRAKSRARKEYSP